MNEITLTQLALAVVGSITVITVASLAYASKLDALRAKPKAPPGPVSPIPAIDPRAALLERVVCLGQAYDDLPLSHDFEQARTTAKNELIRARERLERFDRAHD